MRSPELWLPARLHKSATAHDMLICGMATLDDTIDLDQQLLQTSGVIDSLAYLEKFGKLNWNHGSDPDDLLGEITKAVIRKALGKRGLYIEVRLNPKSAKAQEAYRLMKGGARFGFSVQGVTLRLSKATHNGFPVEKIEESFISQVALTGEPKNYNTFAQILKSLAPAAIDKALTAGTGTDSASFQGGRSLTPENLGTHASEETLRLAHRYFQAHGRHAADLDKSLALFCQTWQLSPSVRARLAEHLKRS